MNREKYLDIKNYKVLHDFLTDVINMIDVKSTEFLRLKSLDHYLIKRTILTAPEVGSSALYLLTYIFFEELEEVSFRENDVTIGFNCYLRPNNQFEIKGAMGSIFEEIDFNYPTTNELTSREKESIFKLINDFMDIIVKFLNKELLYREFAL